MSRRALMVCAIVAVAVALRLVFFTGIILYDDIAYLGRVVALVRGDWSPPEHIFTARLGIVGPPAVAVGLFGLSKASLAAWSFACSIGSVLAAHAFGRRLFDDRTALLAALLVAVLPFDVLGSSMLGANAAQTLFIGSGLALFLLGDRHGRWALHLAAGVCLGIACVTHEVSCFALVFYPVYALAVGRPSRRHLWLLVGMAAALAIDPLVHGAMGDPLAHLHVLRRSVPVQGAADPVAYRGLNLTWLGEPVWRSLTEQELGVYPLLVAPLAVWRLFRPRGATEQAMAMFVVAVGLWTFYGTVSPTSYAPLARVPRYLAPLALPAVWLLGRELATRGARLRLAGLALVGLSSVACLVADGGRGVMPRYELLRDRLALERPSRVLVEGSLMTGLELAEGFQPRYRLAQLTDGADLRGTLVAAQDPARRARVVAQPGAQLVAEVQAPLMVYQRLLATAPVMALLRLVRPRYRVDDLENKAHPRPIAIYRVP